MSWVCQVCRSSGSSDKLSTFYDEDDYRQHLERDHRSIAANELSLVIQMSSQKEPPIYPCCVFCGFLPEAHLRDVESDVCQREIISHMAKSHLQPFALTSVPWDVAGGEHADSGRVSDSSGTNSNDEDIKQQIMNDPRLGGFEISVREAETLRGENGSVQQTALQENNVYAASLDEIGRRSSVKDDQGPKDRVDEWCNDQKTMSAYYTLTDRNRLLGMEEIAISWASMNKNAPETTSIIEGPQTSAVSRLQGGEIPPRLDRKHSIVPLATSSVPKVAEDTEKYNDGEDDATEQDVPTNEKEEFLDIAARGDRERLVEFLSNGAGPFDFNCKDSQGRNAIHLALLSPCPSLIDDLAKAGCNVDYCSWNFGTPLFLAVAQGIVEAVKALLRCSADLDEWFPRQGSALHIACFFQNERLARLLLEHGAKIDQSRRVGFEEVRALRETELDSDGDVDDVKSIASRYSLLDYAIEEVTDSIRGTPLAISAFVGDIRITKLLIEHGAIVDAEATWTDHKDVEEFTATPLALACRTGMSQVVEVLLAAGANIDQEDTDGDTPATAAVFAKSLETLEVLMHHVPRVEDRRKHFGRALREAARTAQADVVRFFLENGVEPDASDIETTPLVSASYKGRYEVVTTLLEAGASVHKTDSDGQSALHNAANGGHAQVLELLIKSGSQVNLQDSNQFTALMASTNSEDTACMLALLDSGANIDMSDDEGTNALAYAAARNRGKHAQVLLERGAHIEATDHAGWTPLIYAAVWDHVELVKLLIDNAADVNHQSGEKLDTPLIAAAHYGSVKAAEVLIDSGAFLEAKNQKGNTALFEASEANKVKVLELLIDRGCLMDGEDDNGDTVLLKTVNAGHVECLQILIEAGATAGPSHHVWELALLLAAEKGNVACLRLLLHKVSPDVTTKIGMTGLMLAVAEGRFECARLLLDAKASIDSIDRRGRTALHHAAGNNEPECTKLLLDRGAKHSCRDHDGRTPLLLLAAKENAPDAENCVAALVDAGASVNEKDDNGYTALWLAAHDGDVSVLRALCSYDGIDKDAFDADDQTVLIHTARDFDRFKKTEILIAAGANLHLQMPFDGRNALAYALSLFSCPAAAALMQAGSDLSMVVTATSSTTLLAVKEGLDDMMTCHYGADCRHLVKANLRQVVTRLAILKQERDSVVALTPRLKERLAEWAQSAKQKIRSRRKHKSVSFATIETPEARAEAGSHSVSEYSSGSESGSFSEDDGSQLQSMESSSNGASSDQPESASSDTISLQGSKID
jgi:ankyrin repeat protein